MKFFLIITIFLIITTKLSAQMYERSVGLRLGGSTGIFFEKQNDDLSSYRFLYSWRDNGKHFTALKLNRKYNINELPESFSIYFGYGLHAGYIRWNQELTNENGHYWEKRAAPVLGLDGMIGISYDFERLPISFTCDIKPYFDLLGRKLFDVSPFDISIGTIYCF